MMEHVEGSGPVRCRKGWGCVACNGACGREARVWWGTWQGQVEHDGAPGGASSWWGCAVGHAGRRVCG